MYTYEMVGVADQNERTYESIFGTYNKSEGFKLDKDTKEFFVGEPEDVYHNIESLVNHMFHDDVWKMVKKDEPKEMSLEDIEKELGYRIRIVDPNADTKKKVTKEQRDEMDAFIDFMNRWLLNK